MKTISLRSSKIASSCAPGSDRSSASRRSNDELEHAESVLFALARSIEARDPYTHGHCERLSVLGVALGRRLGLDEEQLDAIRKAGVLHDVGKIVVPDAILLKGGPLAVEEREGMQRHPITWDETSMRTGRSPWCGRSSATLTSGWMAPGTPDGLAGDAIPITARVLQVVDVFDALTTERPYKQAYPVDQALTMLRNETEQRMVRSPRSSRRSAISSPPRSSVLAPRKTEAERSPYAASGSALPFPPRSHRTIGIPTMRGEKIYDA